MDEHGPDLSSLLQYHRDVQEAGGGNKMAEPTLVTRFAQYRAATSGEIEGAINSGLIVLDSNVLLNLYAYTLEGVEDWFKVLDRVQERVWMPHQVGVEFWSHRARSASDPSDAKGYQGRIEGAAETIRLQAKEWLRRYGPDGQSPDGQAIHDELNAMDDAVDGVIKVITDAVEAHEKAYSIDPDGDAIVRRLNGLFKGDRLGVEPSGQQLEAFKASFSADSPGAADDADNDFATIPKASESKFGDYFIWREMLAEMEERLKGNSPPPALVFVTADSKVDWWQSVVDPNDIPSKNTFRETDLVMPRSTLVKQVHDATQGRVAYIQLRPWEFLEAARTALQVEVSDQTLENAQSSSSEKRGLVTWDDLIGERLSLWRSRREWAVGHLQTGGAIVVAAGALAEAQESVSFATSVYAPVRRALREARLLVEDPVDPTKLRLVEETQFSSLSAASTVLFGAPNVAKKVWRDKAGTPLIDLMGDGPVQARSADYEDVDVPVEEAL
jgi:hypothetical protein